VNFIAVGSHGNYIVFYRKIFHFNIFSSLTEPEGVRIRKKLDTFFFTLQLLYLMLCWKIIRKATIRGFLLLHTRKVPMYQSILHPVYKSDNNSKCFLMFYQLL
jgi:hypothetical protein